MHTIYNIFALGYLTQEDVSLVPFFYLQIYDLILLIFFIEYLLHLHCQW